MASLDDLSTVDELRDYLGLTSTEDDGKITGHRDAAAELIEAFTSRNLLDRSVTVEASGGTCSDLVFWVGDAKPIAASLAIDFRRPTDGPGFARGASVSCPVDRIDVRPDRVICRPDENGWPEREERTLYAATIAAGMADGEVPAAIREATRLLVRELYEGSAMDVIPVGSIVGSLLARYAKSRVPSPATHAAVERDP